MLDQPHRVGYVIAGRASLLTRGGVGAVDAACGFVHSPFVVDPHDDFVKIQDALSGVPQRKTAGL
jgi:hypothetical protein